MSIKNCICELYNSITHIFYIFLGKLFVRKKTNNKVESLIVSDSSIQIINTNIQLNENEIDNIRNYLHHHILYTDHTFHPTYFNNFLHVKFKYQNEMYQICLTKLESTKNEHLDVISTPKYLSAVIISDEGEHCITDTIKEFHGHTKNFFKHIPDTIHDLSIILKDHKKYNSKLHTFDMMGNNQITDL